MGYRVTGLSAEPFQPLFGLSDAELAKRGVRRMIVDQCPGFPDRIELADAPLGATVLLLNHVSQPADTPYRATHAIFVREGATKTYSGENALPEAMRRRLLSLRAFDKDGMLLEADVAPGEQAEPVIERFFARPEVATIHAHHAKQGCYAARIDRT